MEIKNEKGEEICWQQRNQENEVATLKRKIKNEINCQIIIAFGPWYVFN